MSAVPHMPEEKARGGLEQVIRIKFRTIAVLCTEARGILVTFKCCVLNYGKSSSTAKY